MAKLPGWAIIAGGVAAYYMLRNRVQITGTTIAGRPAVGGSTVGLAGSQTGLNVAAKADLGGVVATGFIAAPSIIKAIGQSWGSQKQTRLDEMRDKYADAGYAEVFPVDDGGASELASGMTSIQTSGSVGFADETPSGLGSGDCWFDC